MTRERADRLLVDLGFFDSRAAARAAIEAGGVRADGRKVLRPAQKLAPGARIEAVPAHPFVSRGGVKLAHAIKAFGIEVAGRHCLDIGASTGGFSDVLVQAGACHVTAVDIGRGQFHERLRADKRITVHEGLDARRLEPAHMPAPPGLIVVDVSFISLAKLLAGPLALGASQGELIALFKPQFEIGRAHIGKGGLVRADAPVDDAAEALETWLAGAGWPVQAWTQSPVPGGDGNQERLLHARRA